MPEKQRIALGCMGMSGVYGKTDDAKSLALIQTAIEHGITLLDTGDFYAAGHNELLIGRAIAGRRDKVQLSVKFGGMRVPDGAFLGTDARPIAVKNFLTYSLTRLGTDHVDVYRPARLDPAVPIEDTIGAIADLVKAGYVRKIGLSEMGEALAAKPLTADQLAQVEKAVPRGAIAGTRYAAAQMVHLDSEKR